MTSEKTCCFAGHRKLPIRQIERIVLNLDREVDNLIAQGVTDFISGGALGFDHIAAIYVSTEYHNSCMKKRNRYMVDRSAYCICAVSHGFCGANQTAQYARKTGVHVVNISKVGLQR